MTNAQTVFTKMLTGEIPNAPFLYRNDDRGVSAILSHQYANPGHAVVFSHRPAETVHDLQFEERLMLDVVTHALGNRMKQVYDPLAVVEHTEGFQVPHAHRVVFPVFNRGESDRIHHPEQLTPADDAYYAKVVGELSLTDDMVRASLR